MMYEAQKHTSDHKANLHSDIEAIKERLLQYRENEKDIGNQQERYERLRCKLSGYGVSTLTDMPKNPSAAPDKAAETISKILDIENSLREAIENQKKERTAIEKIIINLKSSKERAVIRTRYLDSMSWHEVSELMFGKEKDYLEKQDSYERMMYRIHGSALLNMAKYQYTERHYYDSHPDGF